VQTYHIVADQSHRGRPITSWQTYHIVADLSHRGRPITSWQTNHIVAKINTSCKGPARFFPGAWLLLLLLLLACSRPPPPPSGKEVRCCSWCSCLHLLHSPSMCESAHAANAAQPSQRARACRSRPMLHAVPFCNVPSARFTLRVLKRLHVPRVPPQRIG